MLCKNSLCDFSFLVKKGKTSGKKEFYPLKPEPQKYLWYDSTGAFIQELCEQEEELALLCSQKVQPEKNDGPTTMFTLESGKLFLKSGGNNIQKEVNIEIFPKFLSANVQFEIISPFYDFG